MNCLRKAAKTLAMRALVALAAAGPGYVAAQPAVSEGGQASYSFPIPVPPGIAGMQPKMALQHTGGRGGPFGAGWGLGGLSVVTRCGSTVATDTVRRGVLYTHKDRFCLDGQRLIAVTAGTNNPLAQQPDYTGAETEYRTEKESYSRIRAYGGNATTGPTHFKVWTKSGLLYEYGLGGNSQVTTVKANQATSVNATWAVNKILDKSGNYMSITYASEINNAGATWGREWMVSEVAYTGNTVTGQPPTNKLVFNYETRPDKTEAFHAGAATVTTKRLASMAAYVGPHEVTFVKLAYDVSPNTGASLLSSVQHCSGFDRNKCLPKTEFTYTPGPAAHFVEKAPPSLTGTQLSRIDNTKGYTRGSYQGDFDGDGRQDILIWDSDPTQNKVLRSTGGGNFEPVSDPILSGPYVHLNHDNACHYTIINDFNLDGISDLLRITDPNARSHCGSLGPVTHIYLGTSTGKFQAPIELRRAHDNSLITLVRQDPAPPPYCNPDIFPAGCGPGWPTGTSGGMGFMVQDFTGDGHPDILFTLSLESAATANPYCPTGERSCLYAGSTTIGRYAKVDSPSLAAAVLFTPSGYIYGQTGIGTYKADRLFVHDLNGDGLPDIYIRDGSAILFATGVPGEFAAASGAAPPCITGAEILDINGDGKWDVACMDRAEADPYKAYVNEGGSFTYRSALSNWRGQPPTCYGEKVGEEPAPVIECDGYTKGAVRAAVSYMAADLDGDGISDILSMGRKQPGSYDANGFSANPLNSFLKGRRDGTFQAMPVSVLLRDGFTTAQLNTVKLEEDKNTVLFGDFTGSGTVEMLRFNQTDTENALFVRDDSRTADMLATVKQAGNAVTTFNYKSTADSSVYTRGFGAIYPVVDQVANRWVVSSIDAPNGVNGTTATTYEYRQTRADLSGRGSFGFGTVKKTTPGAEGTPITTETTYSQVFPYDGLPTVTSKYASGGSSTPLSKTTSVYGKACATSSPEIHRTVLESNTEETRDLNGAWISHVKTENTGFNCYGDPGTVTVTTKPTSTSSKTYVKQTVNTYRPPETAGDLWILGRLETATQTNTVPTETFAAVPNPGWPAPPGPPSIPTVTVTVAPSPMVAGQPATRTWTVTGNATSLTFSCTAASGGYVASGSKAVTGGSDTLNPVTGWIGKPSTCVWTVTGPAGSSTATQTLTTVLPPPTVSVTMSPPTAVAGMTATRTWATTNATSLSFACTASGTGYNASGTKSNLNSSDTLNPTTGWIANPSTCIWTATGSGGTTTATHVINTVAAPLPTISVSSSPNPAVVGQTLTRTWSTTNATSISFSCTAASGGYTGSGTKSNMNSSDTLTPASGWVNSPSTCTWTATGPGGSAQATHVINTVPPKPTISVSMNPSPAVAGSPATRTWSTTNATSLSFSCSAPSGGYTGSGSKPVSGSDTLNPTTAWVASPSTCLWTAQGAGGTSTVTHVINTVLPAPTISVTVNPHPLRVGQNSTVSWTSANATSVSYSCTASGTGFNNGGPMALSSSTVLTGDAAWVGYPSTCVWTASNGSTSATYTHTLTTWYPNPTISVSMPGQIDVGATTNINLTTTNAVLVAYSCNSGAKAGDLGAVVQGPVPFTPDSSWSGTWTCTWTATNGSGQTATTTNSFFVRIPPEQP